MCIIMIGELGQLWENIKVSFLISRLMLELQ